MFVRGSLVGATWSLVDHYCNPSVYIPSGRDGVCLIMNSQGYQPAAKSIMAASGRVLAKWFFRKYHGRDLSPQVTDPRTATPKLYTVVFSQDTQTSEGLLTLSNMGYSVARGTWWGTPIASRSKGAARVTTTRCLCLGSCQLRYKRAFDVCVMKRNVFVPRPLEPRSGSNTQMWRSPQGDRGTTSALGSPVRGAWETNVSPGRSHRKSRCRLCRPQRAVHKQHRTVAYHHQFTASAGHRTRPRPCRGASALEATFGIRLPLSVTRSGGAHRPRMSLSMPTFEHCRRIAENIAATSATSLPGVLRHETSCIQWHAVCQLSAGE